MHQICLTLGYKYKTALVWWSGWRYDFGYSGNITLARQFYPSRLWYWILIGQWSWLIFFSGSPLCGTLLCCCPIRIQGMGKREIHIFLWPIRIQGMGKREIHLFSLANQNQAIMCGDVRLVWNPYSPLPTHRLAICSDNSQKSKFLVWFVWKIVVTGI